MAEFDRITNKAVSLLCSGDELPPDLAYLGPSA
jgi:hypothetical protein